MGIMKRIFNGCFVAIIFAVMSATLLSGCSAVSGITPSQATCDQFLQNMKARQFDAAYTMLSSKCKTVVTQQQLKNYWEFVEKNRGAVTSWSKRGFRTNSNFNGTVISLTYALKCAKGDSGVSFGCVEENGKWLIQAFQFNA